MNCCSCPISVPKLAHTGLSQGHNSGEMSTSLLAKLYLWVPKEGRGTGKQKPLLLTWINLFSKLMLESLELKVSLQEDGFDWQTAMSEQNGSSLTATLKKKKLCNLKVNVLEKRDEGVASYFEICWSSALWTTSHQVVAAIQNNCWGAHKLI